MILSNKRPYMENCGMPELCKKREKQSTACGIHAFIVFVVWNFLTACMAYPAFSVHLGRSKKTRVARTGASSLATQNGPPLECKAFVPDDPVRLAFQGNYRSAAPGWYEFGRNRAKPGRMRSQFGRTRPKLSRSKAEVGRRPIKTR